ncbi:MAG: HAD family hydrolase [Halobacteria archaeon]
MYDYLVFDLDGVLVDVTEGYRNWIFDEIGDELDYSFSDRQKEMLWHGVGEGSREEMLRSWGFDDTRTFWDVYDEVECFEKRLEHTYAYEDCSVLESLDQPMGIVTHSPGELAERALEEAELREHFDSIVSCSYDLGYKPDPSPIDKCLDDMACNGGDALMVGDSVSDVRGAWNAGLSAGHLDRMGHCIEADYRFESLVEVAELTND